MQRICFVLHVKKDRLEEYKERHRTVWPEMIDALRRTGWHNYSLFLRPDGLLVGYLETPDFESAALTLFWAVFFGLLWGIGGLTFGLTMRYLGLSLGMAAALGLCAAFGTLMPPIFGGVFFTQVLGTLSGRIILAGVFVCLLGIAAAGIAGVYKDGSLTREHNHANIYQFNLS